MYRVFNKSSLRNTPKMQSIGLILILIITIINIELTRSAPADTTTVTSESDSPDTHVINTAVIQNPIQQFNKHTKKTVDFYEYKLIVAKAVQQALNECRKMYKWDRWNCPKAAFLSILDREAYVMGQLPLPSNKELSLTRALIAGSIVLSMIKSCSEGTNSMCSCTSPTVVPIQNSDLFQPTSIYGNSGSMSAIDGPPMHYRHHEMSFDQPDPMLQISRRKRFAQDESGAASLEHEQAINPNIADESSQLETYDQSKNSKFAWAGCDEIFKFGFKVAKMYLDTQDSPKGDASKLINRHNYEAGRQAVKRTMKRKCKCHGTSGTCQVNTCWTTLPDISEVGEYLKRQYRVAAKVGAVTASETDAASLTKELSTINPEKLVFADASPDYCYENKQLGINGTLGRYCSRAKHHKGMEVSRSERDSCDRLCTKCGYKIKKELINDEEACDCRFVYCCTVKCTKRCPIVREAYKCVRHS